VAFTGCEKQVFLPNSHLITIIALHLRLMTLVQLMMPIARRYGNGLFIHIVTRTNRRKMLSFQLSCEVVMALQSN